MSDQQPGLFYRRPDGAEVPLSAGEQWIVTLHAAGGLHLQRYLGGVHDESYKDMDAAEGAVALQALSHGFEPPRGLRRRERQAR